MYNILMFFGWAVAFLLIAATFVSVSKLYNNEQESITAGMYSLDLKKFLFSLLFPLSYERKLQRYVWLFWVFLVATLTLVTSLFWWQLECFPSWADSYIC